MPTDSKLGISYPEQGAVQGRNTSVHKTRFFPPRCLMVKPGTGKSSTLQEHQSELGHILYNMLTVKVILKIFSLELVKFSDIKT